MTKVYKDRESNFTHIKNDIFNTANPKYTIDEPLTAKAIGIFCYMWSLPDDWDYYITELAKHFKEQKAAVSTAVSELEKYGFLRRKWHRNKGKFASFDWILNESPLTDYPSTVNPPTENPSTDNRALLSTNGTKYLKNQVLNDEEEEALQTYSSAFGNPSSFIQRKLIKLIKNNGSELFTYAIELAATGNAKSPYNFIKRLLDDWSKHKLTNLDAVKSYVEKFKQSKAKKGSRGRKPMIESTPDWAEKYKDINAKGREAHNKRIEEMNSKGPDPYVQEMLAKLRNG